VLDWVPSDLYAIDLWKTEGKCINSGPVGSLWVNSPLNPHFMESLQAAIARNQQGRINQAGLG
jgi:hypothetical protein